MLYKNDRNSRITFTLTVADGAVSPIDRIELDAASAKKFRLIDLGGNTWAIEYLNNTRPATFKASTVRLSVFLTGCEKSVSMLKLKVSYK